MKPNLRNLYLAVLPATCGLLIASLGAWMAEGMLVRRDGAMERLSRRLTRAMIRTAMPSGFHRVIGSSGVIARTPVDPDSTNSTG